MDVCVATLPCLFPVHPAIITLLDGALFYSLNVYVTRHQTRVFKPFNPKLRTLLNLTDLNINN